MGEFKQKESVEVMQNNPFKSVFVFHDSCGSYPDLIYGLNRHIKR